MADTEQDKKRRRKELLALFALLLLTCRDDMGSSVADYLAGTVSPDTLLTSLLATLGQAHTGAAGIGRQLVGVGGASVTEADEAFGAFVLDGQRTFLDGLLRNLQEGRYADGQDAAHLANRIALYALRLRGTALQSAVRSLRASTMIERRLGGAVERHCKVCPQLVGFYSAADMTRFPGDGSTPCLSLCDCRLLVDGVEILPFVAVSATGNALMNAAIREQMGL